MIKNHTQLLNALIEKYNLKSYLEIGVQNPANNFDKIKLPYDDKYGCDPDHANPEWRHLFKDSNYNNIAPSASDNAFSVCWPQKKWDLIFIDGLHHADQVKRDFENSLRCLSDNGFIVIHDVLPENEEGTKVPRETKVWWGDVYKWAMDIGSYLNIGYKTFNIDNGCMLVYKNTDNKSQLPLQDTSWSNYLKRGKSYMNVTDTVEI